MEIIELLPRQIYRFEYPDLDEFIKIKKNIVQEEYELVHTNSKTINKFLHKDKKYKCLYDWIHECLQLVSVDNNYACEKMEITQSWANKNLKGQSHHPHYHPNSVLSGIFYLTRGIPTTFAYRNNWYVGHPDANIESYLKLSFSDEMDTENIKANPGDLLIFPSTFPHRVDKNEENNERYTISFNSFPSGMWGKPHELMGACTSVL